MRILALPLLLLPLATGGCIAKTAWDVATLPVRAGAQVVDWSTTSQEESDRNYGRKMRKQEAAEGRAMKRAARREREEAKRARERAEDEDY